MNTVHPVNHQIQKQDPIPLSLASYS